MDVTPEMIEAVREHDCLTVRNGHTYDVLSSATGRPFRITCLHCPKVWDVTVPTDVVEQVAMALELTAPPR